MSYTRHYGGQSAGARRNPSYGRPSGGGNRRNSRTQTIDPSRFVRAAKAPADEIAYVPTNTFADFDMHPLLHENLKSKGFETPSPIQDQTIPHGLAGSDVVGIANTGTGKTAAFGIPLLHHLMSSSERRALILAPTRELAQQIEQELKSIGKGSGLKGATLIGGVSMVPQLRDLATRPQIVIGTPGRVKDHAERGTLKLSQFNIVVLDEVDRMLDMGFIGDIRDILSQAASARQSLFFSATLDSRVRDIISSFSADPVHITVKTSDTSDSVSQDVVKYLGRDQKMTKLHDLLAQEEVAKTVVFENTQRNVERLCIELQARGFSVDAIHGGKSQSQRQRALKRFKDNAVTVLVATDVAARGIDIVDISHVVNYSIPESYDDYVHRIGRAGRAGRSGVALTFVEGV